MRRQIEINDIGYTIIHMKLFPTLIIVYLMYIMILKNIILRINYFLNCRILWINDVWKINKNYMDEVVKNCSRIVRKRTKHESQLLLYNSRLLLHENSLTLAPDTL